MLRCGWITDSHVGAALRAYFEGELPDIACVDGEPDNDFIVIGFDLAEVFI